MLCFPEGSLLYLFTLCAKSVYTINSDKICIQKIKLYPDNIFSSVHFSHSVTVVSDSATPWIAARQDSLSITNCRSLPKSMSIKSVMPSSHLMLCRLLLLPPSIFPSIRVFSNESALRIRWPKYWSFSFNISPSNEHPGIFSITLILK